MALQKKTMMLMVVIFTLGVSVTGCPSILILDNNSSKTSTVSVIVKDSVT